MSRMRLFFWQVSCKTRPVHDPCRLARVCMDTRLVTVIHVLHAKTCFFFFKCHEACFSCLKRPFRSVWNCLKWVSNVFKCHRNTFSSHVDGTWPVFSDLMHSPTCTVDHILNVSDLSNSQIALTHANLLKQWRDRAVSGQTEARRVLAEMLTPSGGARSNCYKFISWVTGCSHSTIGRVNEQMKQTGK